MCVTGKFSKIRSYVRLRRTLKILLAVILHVFIAVQYKIERHVAVVTTQIRMYICTYVANGVREKVKVVRLKCCQRQLVWGYALQEISTFSCFQDAIWSYFQEHLAGELLVTLAAFMYFQLSYSNHFLCYVIVLVEVYHQPLVPVAQHYAAEVHCD